MKLMWGGTDVARIGNAGGPSTPSSFLVMRASLFGSDDVVLASECRELFVLATQYRNPRARRYPLGRPQTPHVHLHFPSDPTVYVRTPYHYARSPYVCLVYASGQEYRQFLREPERLLLVTITIRHAVLPPNKT